MRKKRSLLIIVLIIAALPATAWCRAFTIASYNVENLFDTHHDGTEYPDYVPGGKHGWTADMAVRKSENIARVIHKLSADIICLQEIESARSLNLLIKQLNSKGLSYPFSAIADQKRTIVKCAVLSQFPITQQSEIDPGIDQRAILKVTIEIDNRPLVLFVNHWRSKQSPESLRLRSARVLHQEINKLPAGTDFILAGDFNSNYNEHQTILDEPRLNDTNGLTAINHVLGTIKNNKLVEEIQLRRQGANCLYNLWLELPPYRRWSYNFYGHRNSLDHLIVPAALYDHKGISYVDNSFDKFDADFLLQYNTPYRWQRAGGGRGKHLGKGFSDHLPILARFITGPFQPVPSSAYHQHRGRASEEEPPIIQSISSLYKIPPGPINIRLKNCVVIYTHDNNAIIKQPDGRAIFIYKAAKGLQRAGIYDLTAKRLKDFHGLREITQVALIEKKGMTADITSFLLPDTNRDLSVSQLQNEVIRHVKGSYRGNQLHYDGRHSIRLYFKRNILRPPDNVKVILTAVRIGFHNTPELVIEKKDQIRTLQPTQ